MRQCVPEGTLDGVRFGVAVGERLEGVTVGERVEGVAVGERVEGVTVGERVEGVAVGERLEGMVVAERLERKLGVQDAGGVVESGAVKKGDEVNR